MISRAGPSVRPPTRRRVLGLMAAAGLAGCAPRGRLALAPPASIPAAGGVVRTLLVATDRLPAPAPLAYGERRADGLDFAHLDVSIPPAHAVGAIEWPRSPEPDPARDFALAGARLLPDLAALVAATREPRHPPGAEVVVFVHGFNNTFAEGLYRHAQIAHDYGLAGPQVHFAWASGAHPLGYVYDRDSTLIARDALQRLLVALVEDQPRPVVVVGHSLGAFLAMETLRQMAIGGRRRAVDALAGVTLISPDIDVELFRSQAERVMPLPQPFVLVVSRRDRVLGLSARLTGQAARLGSVDDLAALEGLGVTVVDLTGLGGRGPNHLVAGTSPAAIALIDGLRRTGLPDPPPDGAALEAAWITLGPAVR